MTQRTIAAKIAQVRESVETDLSDKAVGHIIHGTGDSPKRAIRLMLADLKAAMALGDAYEAALAKTGSHAAAVIEMGARWERDAAAAKAAAEAAAASEVAAELGVASQPAAAAAPVPQVTQRGRVTLPKAPKAPKAAPVATTPMAQVAEQLALA